MHGNKHEQSALVEPTWGTPQKKKGYMKTFYQKLLIKKEAKKSLVAVIHKIIKAGYHILKNGKEYKDPLDKHKHLMQKWVEMLHWKLVYEKFTCACHFI
jgi:hypothetical protein